jgi:hypothetical protein
MRFHRWAAIVAFLGAALLGGGCATSRHHSTFGDATEHPGKTQSWVMSSGPKTPTEAEGRAWLTIEDTGARVVALAFKNLPQAGSAFEGATMYMVWLVPRGGAPQGMGSLDVSDDERAKMSLRTPLDDFDVLVTAEVDPYVLTPSRNRAFVVEIRPV